MKSAIKQYLAAQREPDFTAADLHTMGIAVRLIQAAAYVIRSIPNATAAVTMGDLVEVAKLIAMLDGK